MTQIDKLKTVAEGVFTTSRDYAMKTAMEQGLGGRWMLTEDFIKKLIERQNDKY